MVIIKNIIEKHSRKSARSKKPMRLNNSTNKHDKTRFTINETSIYINIISI